MERRWACLHVVAFEGKASGSLSSSEEEEEVVSESEDEELEVAEAGNLMELATVVGAGAGIDGGGEVAILTLHKLALASKSLKRHSYV